MNKEKYGWAICMACALQLFCVSGLATTGFSACQLYLITIGRLTNTQASYVSHKAAPALTLSIMAGILIFGMPGNTLFSHK